MTRDAVFSLHPIRWHLILICPITGDINFDHLTKVASVRFFHCKVIYFLYVGRYSETMYVFLTSSNFYPLMFPDQINYYYDGYQMVIF